jgi:hypothetical protein
MNFFNIIIIINYKSKALFFIDFINKAKVKINILSISICYCFFDNTIQGRFNPLQ